MLSAKKNLSRLAKFIDNTQVEKHGIQLFISFFVAGFILSCPSLLCLGKSKIKYKSNHAALQNSLLGSLCLKHKLFTLLKDELTLCDLSYSIPVLVQGYLRAM